MTPSDILKKRLTRIFYVVCAVLVLMFINWAIAVIVALLGWGWSMDEQI